MTNQSNFFSSFAEVGKIGKTFGLNGGLKFHLTTDFPQSIQENLELTLKSPQNNSITPCIYTIKSFNTQNSVVFFKEIQTIEEAKTLCNLTAYVSIEDTKKRCLLQTDEYFWFDIIGCAIIEDEKILGKVKDIERIGKTDYLLIQTTDELLSEGLPKHFMIPYIEHFISKTSIEQKLIFTKGAKGILEAS